MIGLHMAAKFPSADVTTFLNVAAALLAVSVAVYAFVPLIIELALQRSADADIGVRRATRADAAFGALLFSVAMFGISLLLGILATYAHVQAVHIAQVVLLVMGVVLLLAGTLSLGHMLRAFQRGGR